jgi:hypothetical protein
LSGGYTTDETIHDFFNLKDHLTRKNTIDEIPQQLHTDLHHQSNHLARTALQIIPKRKNHYRWLEGYFIDQQHTFINQRQKKSHDQISNNFICLDKDEWKKLQNDLQSTENEKKPTLHSDH